MDFIKKNWWWIVGFFCVAGASAFAAGLYTFVQIMNGNPRFIFPNEGGLVFGVIAGYVAIAGLVIVSVGLVLAAFTIFVKLFRRLRLSRASKLNKMKVS